MILCSLFHLSSFQNRNILTFCSNSYCFNIHALIYMKVNHMMEESMLLILIFGKRSVAICNQICISFSFCINYSATFSKHMVTVPEKYIDNRTCSHISFQVTPSHKFLSPALYPLNAIILWLLLSFLKQRNMCFLQYFLEISENV